jgi:hypothetical protein
MIAWAWETGPKMAKVVETLFYLEIAAVLPAGLHVDLYCVALISSSSIHNHVPQETLFLEKLKINPGTLGLMQFLSFSEVRNHFCDITSLYDQLIEKAR